MKIRNATAAETGWPTWQQPYRYGALVIVPRAEIARLADRIRQRFDPASAAIFGAHITLTPPFARGPSPAHVRRIAEIVASRPPLTLALGPAARFPDSTVVYLAVKLADRLAGLRSVLMVSGLFRTDMPHANAFVPHLTLSELGADPDAVLEAARSEGFPAAPFQVPEVAWITPDERFHFSVRRTFPLAPR